MKLFRPLLMIVAAVLLGIGFGAAQAQSFPSKSITLVVPYQPGGTNDIIARIVGSKL